MNSAKIAVVVFACSFGTGCAARVAQSYGPYDGSPSRSRLVTASASPLPVLALPGNREARADQLMGSIAASLGVVQHMADDAAQDRDVVRLNCERDKLQTLFTIESDARARRSDVRDDSLEDDEGPAFGQLASLEERARGLRNEATQCVGEEGAYASGDDQLASGRMVQLESRVAELKTTVQKSKMRLELLDDTVLAGVATGPSGGNLAATPAALPATTAPPPPTQPAAAQTSLDVHDPSMLIRTAEIALAVYEVDKNLDAVEKKAASLGGYLALRSDRQITVRVPREKFDELVAAIAVMGDVLHKNVASEDVTDQYVDLSMRLKNATSVRARLEKLLETAAVRDAIEIHKELGKVTEEIERLEGKLKLLRDRIAYSTVTVSFEKNQQQAVHSQALLPFPWMGTMGLGPLLRVPR